MKIAHVVPCVESVPPQSKNGLEFIVAWLVEGLIKRGHEVTLFAPADSTASTKLRPLLSRGFSKQDIPGFEQLVGEMSIWNTVYAATFARDFDIIHCHTAAAHIAHFTDKPLVQTVHNPYVREFMAPLIERPQNHSYLTFLFDQYKKINFVTVSNNQRDIFKKFAGDYYFKKYHTIYNGIPVEQFTYNGKPEDYLFFIGYINEDKGAHIAVQVARALGRKLIIAGDNSGQDEFFQEHIAPYLNDDIQYVGPVGFEEKNKLYGNALATLAPLQWDEPFGLTLAEPQACGTPVIALNRGAAAEVVKHGETGFVVNTVEEMTQAVENIGAISRKKCREWAEQNFSMQRMIDEYEQHYKDILSKA